MTKKDVKLFISKNHYVQHLILIFDLNFRSNYLKKDIKSKIFSFQETRKIRSSTLIW